MGQSARFSATLPELCGEKRFTALLLAPFPEYVKRARFEVDVEKLKAQFVCPMDCERGKTYLAAGSCGVCKMALVDFRTAHADHNPKHGGVFFMAPNQWHHLEGVLISPREFRVYMYNNFTRPIGARAFAQGSTVQVHRGGNAPKMNLELKASDDGEYLKAELFDGLALPLSLSARIKFEGKTQGELFDFRFEKLSDFK